MLFVLSKEKIISYIIAFSTVIILIGIAMFNLPYNGTLQTMAEGENNTEFNLDCKCNVNNTYGK